MEVAKYKTMMSDEGLPELLKEKAYTTKAKNLDNPRKIVRFMKEVFQLHKETEEYAYEVCFTTKFKPIAIFEISHGTINMTPISTREFYQKALLAGAAKVVIVHNHPSGEVIPSKEDDKITAKLKAAGELLNIELCDSIIIGKGYYSYREQGEVI